MKFSDTSVSTIIPTKIVGPIDILYGDSAEKESVHVPLATFEAPLWHSVKRGALVSQKVGGIRTAVFDDFMTRSIILESSDVIGAQECCKWISDQRESIANVAAASGKFAKLVDISSENVGKLLYIRFSISTGEASGHNMVTKAADEIADFIISHFKNIQYVSVSGNYCVDKKVSAINGILGRGKRVTAEITVPKNVCESVLKTTPAKICALNTKKNFVGSILAGSIRSANAHYANILLAMYLATGQDAANIVEGSQGITFADMINNDSDLYFSVTLPNIIVGTIGNGKNLDFARNNLDMMKCLHTEKANSSKKFAAVIAATVLCSELSLIAAQTNQGELMRSHIFLERKQKDGYQQ